MHKSQYSALDNLYPHHIKALENVKLQTSNVYPTLKECVLNLEAKNTAIESMNDTLPEEQLWKEHMKVYK